MESEEQTTLFIGGLTPDTTEDDLVAYFSIFGVVDNATIIIDWVTGKSKNCAIVKFQDKKGASTALEKKKHLIRKFRVRVKLADKEKKSTKIVKTTKLYVGNILSIINDEDVYSYFVQYGKLKGYEFIASQFPFGNSHAFIEFQNEEDAARVLEVRQSIYIKGNKISCAPYRAKTVLEKQRQEQEVKDELDMDTILKLSQQINSYNLTEPLQNWNQYPSEMIMQMNPYQNYPQAQIFGAQFDGHFSLIVDDTHSKNIPKKPYDQSVANSEAYYTRSCTSSTLEEVAPSLPNLRYNLPKNATPTFLQKKELLLEMVKARSAARIDMREIEPLSEDVPESEDRR